MGTIAGICISSRHDPKFLRHLHKAPHPPRLRPGFPHLRNPYNCSTQSRKAASTDGKTSQVTNTPVAISIPLQRKSWKSSDSPAHAGQNFETYLRKNKEKVVNTVLKAAKTITIDNAIKVFGISRSTIQSWLTQVKLNAKTPCFLFAKNIIPTNCVLLK